MLCLTAGDELGSGGGWRMEDGGGCPTVNRLAKHAVLKLSQHFNYLVPVKLISTQMVNNN